MILIEISLITPGYDIMLPSAGVLYDSTSTVYLHAINSFFVFQIDFWQDVLRVDFIDSKCSVVWSLYFDYR